jgi:FkbM family methyltransferase
VSANNKIAMWLKRATLPWQIRGIPRLLYASRHLLLGSEPRLFPLGPDARIFLDPEDYTHCMMFYGRYSPEIVSVFRRFVRPGDAVIDVGAHIGYLTLHLAALVGQQGHVYSFEPDDRVAVNLDKSIAASNMTWIHAFRLALTAQKQDIEFYLAQGHGSSTAVKASKHLNVTQTVVPGITLDELVADGKVVSKIRLIKMDIEGFEIEALKGMRELIRRSRPIMVVEVNEERLTAQGESASRLLALLESFGYTVRALAQPRKLLNRSHDFVTSPVSDELRAQRYYDVLCTPN